MPDRIQSRQQPNRGDLVTKKIDPAHKSAWVAALRSGKYPQGVGALFQHKALGSPNQVDIGYCCLGVGATAVLGGELNASGEHATLPDGRVFDSEGSHYETGHWEDGDYLPGNTEYLFDMDQESAEHLTWMNDGENFTDHPGHTFAEIADWIEENL